MSSYRNRAGGLRLSGKYRDEPLYASANLPDISWLHRCRVGDDQGNAGACSIFAFASWVEIMQNKSISDKACLDLYSKTIKSLGRGDEGLTFSEAFKAVQGAGWIPKRSVLSETRYTNVLAHQPIIAGYDVTDAFYSVSDQGCLNHRASRSSLGAHAVVIVACGRVEKKSVVYIENSWGLGWGWKGIGYMTTDLHTKLCEEMWVVI